jgi:hypothetical protein
VAHQHHVTLQGVDHTFGRRHVVSQRLERDLYGSDRNDVLALLDPASKRTNFCSIILKSAWKE